jgi:hypothetical protein
MPTLFGVMMTAEGHIYKGKRTKADIMSGVKEDVISSKFVMSNTIEYFTPDGRRVIRYHDTDILTFYPDGSVKLLHDGWDTRTTKDRMNALLGKDFYIFQERKKWYVVTRNKGTIPYEDGMILNKRPKWRV